jgi:hypothetical protein
MPNSKKYIFPWVPTNSDPNISGPTPKFKIWLTIFQPLGLRFPNRNATALVGQKHREEMDFLETGYFQHRAYP